MESFSTTLYNFYFQMHVAITIVPVIVVKLAGLYILVYHDVILCEISDIV